VTPRQAVTRIPAASHSLCFRFKLIGSVAVDIHMPANSKVSISFAVTALILCALT